MSCTFVEGSNKIDVSAVYYTNVPPKIKWLSGPNMFLVCLGTEFIIFERKAEFVTETADTDPQ